MNEFIARSASKSAETGFVSLLSATALAVDIYFICYNLVVFNVPEGGKMQLRTRVAAAFVTAGMLAVAIYPRTENGWVLYLALLVPTLVSMQIAYWLQGRRSRSN